jgi:hypothetical protein
MMKVMHARRLTSNLLAQPILTKDTPLLAIRGSVRYFTALPPTTQDIDAKKRTPID